MTVVDITADVVTRPLRRVEYDALIAQGFLVGEPIELVEGHLVTMTPQGDRHWLVITHRMSCRVAACRPPRRW
jgi:hypothetical protein